MGKKLKTIIPISYIKVVKAITEFVSEDLSNWYIRRNRKRFWASELDNSKKSVYITTYEVLEGLCRMIAPVVPFVTDEIYTKLTGEKTVHLADYPKYDEKLMGIKWTYTKNFKAGKVQAVKFKGILYKTKDLKGKKTSLNKKTAAFYQ